MMRVEIALPLVHNFGAVYDRCEDVRMQVWKPGGAEREPAGGERLSCLTCRVRVAGAVQVGGLADRRWQAYAAMRGAARVVCLVEGRGVEG